MLCLDEVDTSTMLNRVIWHDIAMYSYNNMRKSSSKMKLKQVVIARVRALCRESPVVERLMRSHKASHQDNRFAQIEDIIDWR